MVTIADVAEKECTFKTDTAVPCPDCKKKGQIEQTEPSRLGRLTWCHTCHGAGWLYGDGKAPHHQCNQGFYVANLGTCYNRYMCDVCGKQQDIDSSD